MKKLTMILTLLVGIALFASFANAQLTVTAATLGSDTAEADTNVSTSVTLTNTGSTTLTGISLASTAAGKYAVGFSGVPTTLAPSASATVTVSGLLHIDTNAINSAFNNDPVQIGNLVASAAGNVSASNTLSAQVENMLKIKKILITVNGDEEHSLDDGDDLSDLKPGDKLEITVQVENNFDDSDDEEVDIEDATVVIELDSDFDTGDEEQDIDTVSADSEESVDFDTITIEDEASGTYTLEVSIKGHRDDTSTGSGEHGERAKIDLKVERESHEIAIRTATLSPSKVLCGKNTVDAKLKVVNIGKSNEDEVALELSIPALGITERKEAIELDKNDELSRTISATLPAGTKAGSYSADIVTYWNGDTPSDSVTLTFEVESCTAAPTTPTVQPTQPTGPVTPPTTTTAPVTTVSSKKSTSFLDSGAGIATLSIGVIAAIVILIVLITMLMKKPAQ